MPAEFSISESPLADATPSSGVVVPPPVDVFPTTSLGSENVKLRFFEPNVPQAINTRWVGMPRGVYLGFIPTVTAGSKTLSLVVDPQHNFSLLKVVSSVERVMVDIFTADTVSLNFTGHTQFPVNVMARGEFSLGNITGATIFTSVSGPAGQTEVLICQVDHVNGELEIVPFTAETRQRPVAFVGQQYGFMDGGSIENLNEAVTVTSEVAVARLSPYTAPPGGTPGVDAHPDLKSRIDADQDGTAIADRLFLRSVSVLSNRHAGVIGTTANVSGSFTESGREFGPNITIEPGGSETTEGALTSPTDTTRNTCFLIDDDTGERIIDPISREPIYGELSFTSGTVGATREIFFVNASTDVIGINSPFSSLQEGDAVLGPPEPAAPGGRYYEVAQIVDPNTAVLGAAFQGDTDSVVDAAFRRFTISFTTTSLGPFAFTGRNIRFSIPCFFRVDRAIYDATLFLKKMGERPPLQLASQVTEGKGLLAVDAGKVGSLRTVKDEGIVLGNDIHTLNFIEGGATAAPGNPGVVNVAVTGPDGPPGPDSDQGPPGPTGGTAPGLQLSAPFEDSLPSPAGPAPPALFTHTYDFAANGLTSVAHFYGNISAYYGALDKLPRHIVTLDVAGPASTNLRIEVLLDDSETGARLAVANISHRLYLGAAQ